MRVTFVNHACVKISIGDLVILCDPWLDGPAFNFGWDLLVNTPLGLDEVMRGVTHIWVSHEHPDHLVPKFFRDIAPLYKSVPVLFQQTRDGRVRDFLVGQGFEVLEMPAGKTRIIDGVRLTVGTAEFYDSWLHVTDGTASLLNLNDCPIAKRSALAALARRVGPIDVLLTQFSYAAWKGGRDDTRFRENAARNKLATLHMQVEVLRPRVTIPFASFVYFSNEENAYLNDRVNTPDVAAAAIDSAGSRSVVLFPGDVWDSEASGDDGMARERFRQVYSNLAGLPMWPPGASVSVDQLAVEFDRYRTKIFELNSKALINIIRHIPLLGAFEPVAICLTDLDTTVSVSIVDGFEVLGAKPSDVAMHSSSLAFVFKNLFGFDTLTVNGRFEATPAGFSKLTKSLALGSLNGLGLSIGPGLVTDYEVVVLLLQRLAGVMKKMSRARPQAVQPSLPGTSGEHDCRPCVRVRKAFISND